MYLARTKIIGLIIVVLAASTAISFLQSLNPQQVQKFSIPRIEKNDRYGKIEPSLLLNSLEQHAEGSSSFLIPQVEALDTQNRTRVVIELSAGDETYLQQLRSYGFQIESFHGKLVQARLTQNEIYACAALPFIEYIRSPIKPVEFAVTSEGVQTIRANLAQNAGFTGAGSKVAVIDSGFDLNNPQIKNNIAESRSFRGDGDISATFQHGTAVSEIIVDVAPSTRLYLYNIETDVEFLNAIDFAVSRGVNVINLSIGFVNAGPTDGTSEVSQVVDRARASGVLVVSAAGNYAQEHWEGTYTDTNNDGINEFAPGEQRDSFRATAGSFILISLAWNDWPRSGQDYDLYLVDSSSNVVAASTNPQTGGQPPREELVYRAAFTGTYSVVIVKFRATRNVDFQLYVLNYPLQFNVAQDSVTSPADARGSLTVGATFYQDDRLEPFSSRGPTGDGRIKPDIAGPDGVSTSVFGQNGFFGTSASTPHVTGVAALLYGANPAMTPDQVQSRVESTAIDLGDPGKDNSFGSGEVDASAALNLAQAGGMTATTTSTTPTMSGGTTSSPVKRTLEIHAHTSGLAFSSEPGSEIPASISVSYVQDGLLKSDTRTPVFQIQVDTGSTIQLSISSVPAGYSFQQWQLSNGQIATSGSITFLMDQDMKAVAFLTPTSSPASTTTTTSQNTPAGTRTLEVHSHPDEFQFPQEPAGELPASIRVTYLLNGNTVTATKNPVFQIQVDAGTQVTLEIAGVPSGYVWHEWDNFGIGRTSSTTLTLFMDRDRVAIAYFTRAATSTVQVRIHAHPDQYQFPSEPPQELPATIEASYRLGGALQTTTQTARFDITVDSGSQVTLKMVSPPSGFVWHEWDDYGQGRSSDQTLTFTTNQDADAVAYFSPLQSGQFSLIIATSPAIASVKFSIDGMTRTTGSDGRTSLMVDPGPHIIQVIDSSTSSGGSTYVFVGWSGAATGVINPVQVTINSDTSLTANFTSGIPGFPAESIVVGLALAGGFLISFRRSRRTFS